MKPQLLCLAKHVTGIQYTQKKDKKTTKKTTKKIPKFIEDSPVGNCTFDAIL